eukprot:TRINITY_DN9013_c0_g1_i1.p1 TRINITY_DN9013_c0_g1~~TRINITY_DN9013_c0_g1_i1.p1  ORF type:complete len:332 (+),score=54.84 TRINITY_DN9013_c0_g1_i1:196-1191(+)
MTACSGLEDIHREKGWSLPGVFTLVQEGIKEGTLPVTTLCWLFKDMGWCLLCWPVSVPSGVCAFVLEFRTLGEMARDLGVFSGEVVHTAALVCWLAGNCAWMVGEFLFEGVPKKETGRHYPWFDQPLVGDATKPLDKCVWVARCCLGTGVSMLILYYIGTLIHCLMKRSKGNREELVDGSPPALKEKEEPLVFGMFNEQTYALCFVGPWMCKDICWTVDAVYYSLGFSLIVAMLILDNWRRFGNYIFLAEFWWVCGNTAWLCNEDIHKDRTHIGRVTAVVCFIMGIILVNAEFLARHAELKQEGRSPPKETSPLIPHPGAGTVSAYGKTTV